MHLVLTADGLGHGAGQYGLEPPALERMRQGICDPDDRGRLQAALRAAETVQSTLDPPDLARLLKGHESVPQWEHLLRRKTPVLRTQGDVPAPEWLSTPEAPARLAAITQAHLPLLDWLIADAP